MRTALAMIAAAGLLVAGCGDTEPTGTRTDSPALVPPPVSTTAATPPPTTTAATATAPGATTTTSEPDAGDEAGTRVPASFRVGPDRATPRTITVPPFLAVELKLRSSDANAHEVVLTTPTPVVVEVPADGTATKRIDGLERGSYRLRIDDTEIGTLRVADDAVGP